MSEKEVDTCPHCGMQWTFVEDIDHSTLGGTELERHPAGETGGREPGDKITCVDCGGRATWDGTKWTK
jgi:hypothetical protein